ncbi:lectin-like protein [Psychroflexus sp. ALD_RP9]|uniref:lectin-like protein n=1 Tax=Psychroflexus sp. ALD_RP9 TaxID=2777186 RepID=UPI001A8DC621|nr:lectin-like protein [Psychroflexus sp. ALD_RP9]QSS96885.1 HYR domain-containing protein [Psychroflexus sp. ALD_RP9]
MKKLYLLFLIFSAFITKAQNNPPTFSSVSNINQNTTSNSEVVNFSLPSISDDEFGNNISFEDYPPTPTGFTRVGVFNGHTYFISNNNNSYNNHLSSISSVAAAHPVSINSAEENEFLRAYLASNGINVALIGFNDIASETNFVWQNGDPVTYTNWRFNAPAHTTANHDVVEMQFDNGTWNDVSTALSRRMFIELPYAAEQIDGLPSGSDFPLGVTVNRFRATDDVGNVATTSFNVVINDIQNPLISCPSNISTPVTTNLTETVSYTSPTFTDNSLSGTFSYDDAQEISGFTKIGKHNNHTYYISNTNNTYTNFLPIINSINAAYPISINNAAENTFLANYLQSNSISSVLIGFTDTDEEGNFKWESGESVTYTNWNANEPNNFGSGEDYVQFFSSGLWNDITNNSLPIIIEVPFTTEQTAGLASGANFPVGTTTNTFIVNDSFGNTATCSFDVTVETAPTIESQPSLITLNSIPQNLDLNDFNITTDDADGDNVTLTSSISQFDCNNVAILQSSVRYGNGASNTLGAGNVQTFKSLRNGFLTKLEVEFRGNTSATTQAVIEVYQNNNADPNLATDVELIGTVTLNIPAQFNAIGEGNFDKPIYLELNRMYAFRQISGPGIRMRQGSFYTAGATFNHDFNNSLVVTESAGINDDWKFFVTQFDTNGVTSTSVPVSASDGTNNTNANVDAYHLSNITPTAIAQNISIDLDANGNASITPQQIDNGSSVVCNGNMNLSLDISSFDCSSIGDNTVVLTVEDDYGNSSTASAVVTVQDNTGSVFSALNNVNINTTGSSEIINYSLPTITDNCIGNAIGFENYPPTPSGFTKMGVFNGHTYFISNSTDTYANFLSTINTLDGAYPVSISSAAENNFIANYLSENGQSNALIGINDLLSEGTFIWENGENVSYTNWNSGEPNNSGGNEDVTEIYNNGGWNDIGNANNDRPIIIEFSYAVEQTAGLASGSSFPIGTTTNTFEAFDEYGNTSSVSFTVTVSDTGNPSITCPDDITTTATNPIVNFSDPVVTDNSSSSFNILSGMTYIGNNDGKNFFISDEIFSGANAFADAVNRGGTVATVSNATQNTFLANALSTNGISNAHIGFSDAASEGNFVWQDGSPTTYTNWQTNEPSNTNGVEDYVAISSGGSWNDVGAFGTGNLRYILQLDQEDAYVLQTSGPSSGSNFPIGTTTVTFEAFDAAGNTATCSFDVTVTDFPNVITQNIDVALDPSGNASITAQDIDNGSSSVSGIASLSIDQSSFDCSDISTTPSSVSLNFEGNGHIQIDGNAPLDFGGSKGFTFETQIYPRSNANSYILSKTLGGASWPTKLTTQFYINTNNQLVFGINRFSSGGWTYLNSPQNSITLNQWQHVAVSYNSSNSTMKIYIEGIEVASTTLNTSNPTASPGLFRIGAAENGGNQFDGYMDNFRAWENALDTSEVFAAKNNNLSAVNNTLLLHYAFNSNFGTEAVDLSSTERNGTFTGSLNENSWYTGTNNLNPNGTTVTLTVTSNSGDVATGTAVVNVTNNFTPTIASVPDDILDYTTNSSGKAISYNLPLSSTNCLAPQSLDNYPPTPSGFTKMGVFQGHTYFVSNSQNTFTNFSTQVSAIQDAHFATITNPEENNFIANYLTNNSLGNAYIGLNDQQNEGDYVWETGEEFIYTNWNSGNPSNSGSGEDVGEIFPDGGWNDLPENLIRYAIIEIPYAIEQTSGSGSGETFSPGTTTNEFKVYGKGGGISTFNFDVEIIQADYIYLNDAWLDAKNPNGIAVATETMLVVDNEASLTSPISLAEVTIENSASVEVNDVLSVTTSITNNGQITFKSNATSTAQLDEFTGTISGTGTVEVERYIPAKRAFRLISSAVDGSTIANAWQQDTHITGAVGTVGQTSTDGFDETETGNPSMFTFDNTITDQSSGAGWQAITSTTDVISAGTPYRLMVRGDRTIDLADNEAPATATTLSASGTLHTGSYSPTLATAANNYSFVGNPYQAVVDFGAVTKSNLTDFIYVWDASIAGSNGNGGYTVVDASDGSEAAPSPYSSAANQYIMPGQAFFVQNNASGNGSITFEEADKATGQAQVSIFSTYTNFYINSRLYKASALQNGEMESDAIGLRFNENYTTIGSDEDASKLANPGENYAIVNNGFKSIDKQNIPTDGHQVDLLMMNYEDTAYSLSFNLGNQPETLKVYLNDSYLNTQTELTESTTYDFTVDANVPESIDQNRFHLSFEEVPLNNQSFDAGQVRLYPNPVVHQLQIELPASVEINSVQVFNTLGQQVLTTTQSQVDVSQLASGVYVVELETTKGKVSKKIIKQ